MEKMMLEPFSYIIRVQDGFKPLNIPLYVWWKVPNLLMSNKQMEMAGLLPSIWRNNQQLKLWLEGSYYEKI